MYYYQFMNINDWSNKEIIKFLINRKGLTQKSVIPLIAEKISAKITPQSFSERQKRNNLRISELQAICDILGFDLIVQERK